LALLLMTFWFAKTQRWWLAGLSGFFLSLCRVEGVVFVLPLVYLYFQKQRPVPFKIKSYFLAILLIPLGAFTFFAYTYYQMRDWLAYFHAQHYWISAKLSSPFFLLSRAVFSGNLTLITGAISSISALFLGIFFSRKIGLVNFFVILFYILPHLFFDIGFHSQLRYILKAFPLYLIFAIMAQAKNIDEILTIALGLIQGFFMVFWANGFWLIV